VDRPSFQQSFLAVKVARFKNLAGSFNFAGIHNYEKNDEMQLSDNH